MDCIDKKSVKYIMEFVARVDDIKAKYGDADGTKFYNVWTNLDKTTGKSVLWCEMTPNELENRLLSIDAELRRRSERVKEID